MLLPYSVEYLPKDIFHGDNRWKSIRRTYPSSFSSDNQPEGANTAKKTGYRPACQGLPQGIRRFSQNEARPNRIISGNHGAVKPRDGVGGRRVVEFNGGIGSREIGQGHPLQQVGGNLDVAVQPGRKLQVEVQTLGRHRLAGREAQSQFERHCWTQN